MADGNGVAAPAAAGQSKGGTGAPPPEVSPSGEGGAPAADAPSKPLTVLEELGGLLKTKGGLKYKHKGQERVIDDPQELLRKVSMADLYQDSTQELVRLRQETAAEKQRQEALKGLRGSERIKALKEMFGDELDNDITEDVISRARQEESLGKLSPAERELRAENERLKAAAQKREREQQAALEQLRSHQEQQATEKLRADLHEHLGAVLRDAKIDAQEAPEFIPLMARMIQQAAALRLPLDRATLAKEAVKMDEELTAKKLQRKTPERLLGMLRASGQLGPLIKAYVAAAKAAGGQSQTGEATAAPAPKPNGQQQTGKRDWRTFWGNNPVPTK